MKKTIELTREEIVVLREALRIRIKDLGNYQREAMWAGDPFGVEDAGKAGKIIQGILDKLGE